MGIEKYFVPERKTHRYGILCVTADKYQLPIAYADDLAEMAKLRNAPIAFISRECTKYARNHWEDYKPNGKKRCLYCRVVMGD